MLPTGLVELPVTENVESKQIKEMVKEKCYFFFCALHHLAIIYDKSRQFCHNGGNFTKMFILQHAAT
jgi:hypothetical protein